jgi:hypothetical protein
MELAPSGQLIRPSLSIKHVKKPLGKSLEIHPTVEFNATLRQTILP